MGKRGAIRKMLVITLVLVAACSEIRDLSPSDDSPSLAIPTSVLHPTATPSPTATPTPTSTPTPPPPQIPPQTVQSMFIKLMQAIPAQQGYGYVSPDDFKQEMASANKPFIIDVRDPDELIQAGYIEGAVNIPIRVLLRELDKLPGPVARILIYSDHGNRSGIALAALMLLGYTNVRDLAGGYSSWVHVSNYPVITGSPPTWL